MSTNTKIRTCAICSHRYLYKTEWKIKVNDANIFVTQCIYSFLMMMKWLVISIKLWDYQIHITSVSWCNIVYIFFKSCLQINDMCWSNYVVLSSKKNLYFMKKNLYLIIYQDDCPNCIRGFEKQLRQHIANPTWQTPALIVWRACPSLPAGNLRLRTVIISHRARMQCANSNKSPNHKYSLVIWFQIDFYVGVIGHLSSIYLAWSII